MRICKRCITSLWPTTTVHTTLLLFVLRLRLQSRTSTPSRSHVRNPWSGQCVNLDQLRLVPLVAPESRVSRPCIHASAFLNHWTSGTLSLQGRQVSQSV